MLQALMSVFPADESDSELGTPHGSDMEFDDTDIVVPSPPTINATMIPGNRGPGSQTGLMRKFYQLLREDSEGISG